MNFVINQNTLICPDSTEVEMEEVERIEVDDDDNEVVTSEFNARWNGVTILYIPSRNNYVSVYGDYSKDIVISVQFRLTPNLN